MTFRGALLGFAPANAQAAAPVDLGAVGDFVLLAGNERGVNDFWKLNTADSKASVISGNVGSRAGINGFALTADPSGTFSTAPNVAGKNYAAGDAAPTPEYQNEAFAAWQTAYDDAAGRTPGPGYTNLGGGYIGAMTLSPGVYKWTRHVYIKTDITLEGTPDDVFILQVKGDVNFRTNGNVILKGGAQAKNVFWQLEGGIAVSPRVHIEGVFLIQAGFNLNFAGGAGIYLGASLRGRMLTRRVIVLQSVTIDAPPSKPTATPTPAPTSTPTFVPTSTPSSTPTSTPTFMPTSMPTSLSGRVLELTAVAPQSTTIPQPTAVTPGNRLLRDSQ